MNRHAHRLSLGTALILLLFLAVSAATAGALDLVDGRMKLTLHEGNGRFSLSCQVGGKDGVYVPLIASEDPRTTMLSVVVGNKVYVMGDTAEFSQAVEKTGSGARFIWRSVTLQVTETFTFVASSDSPVSNGVRIDIAVKNISQQDISAGVRYLFDTYLGEASFVHFRTDTLTQLSNELSLSGASRPAYWVSPLAGDPQDFGLMVMTSGAGITVPDRIIFANWKRLSDASWIYDTSEHRNFSMLPYSVNDSAACEYFDPRPLPRGAEMTVTMVLGQYSRSGFTPAATTLAQSLAAAASDGQGVRADLSIANSILAQIDAGISTGTLSDDELARLEAALKELESRAARYAPHSGQ
ncbi:MAG: hypothetical protein ABSG63_12890 [Spirochaetia bacterium]|jgi:hypothetical protein